MSHGLKFSMCRGDIPISTFQVCFLFSIPFNRGISRGGGDGGGGGVYVGCVFLAPSVVSLYFLRCIYCLSDISIFPSINITLRKRMHKCTNVRLH